MNNVNDNSDQSTAQALGDTVQQAQKTNQADDQTIQNFDINNQPQEANKVSQAPSNPTSANPTSTNSIPTDPPTVTEVNELSITDVVSGSGNEVKDGDSVEVHYLGTFLSGEKFDSSHDRNETFNFKVGAGEVIKGWDQGLVGMKAGGKRVLLIPSDLAYGERGAPGAIPPNTPLKFEIELISINSN